MIEKIDYTILRKFAGGKYSLSDFKLVSRWFDDVKQEKELKDAIREHWDEFSSDSFEEKDLSLVLENIKQKITSEKQSSGIGVSLRILNLYMRIAAVLILPLLLYSVYTTFVRPKNAETASNIEIFSPHGARTHFELPDGTQGWLNSGSQLQYGTDILKNRKVRLIGEAWFEVSKMDNKTFVVSTTSLDVQVLGTKFNVAAFPDEKVTDVVLKEGKVKVNGYKGKFAVELKPDEKFTFDKDLQSGSIQNVNADQFSAWKDGILVFRNEPFSEVLKRVGRWYNVDFKITDKELANFRYRATFKEEQVEEVIRLISLTAPIVYSFDDREIDENGIFKKRTITISRKRN
jgi:ferric-dicitrate binding protein FerR (iron transport regulator)